jgi:hypothetical protein
MRTLTGCFVSPRCQIIRSNWKAHSLNPLGFQRIDSGAFLESSYSWALSQSEPQYDDGIMSFHDVLVGILIALAIALFPSILQATLRRFLISSESTVAGTHPNDDSKKPGEASVFGAESWNDISKPENYILYTTKIRNRLKESEGNGIFRIGKRGTLLALLLLFIPIFSFELFLALSRQFLCEGDPLSLSGWQLLLCSPHLE